MEFEAPETEAPVAGEESATTQAYEIEQTPMKNGIENDAGLDEPSTVPSFSLELRDDTQR